MNLRNILMINKKISEMEALRKDIIALMPKNPLAKATFNMKDKKRVEIIHYFDKALAMSNIDDIYMPDNNYMLLLEAIRILERGIYKQREILSLCIHVNQLELSERAQAEFDEAAFDNDKDKCLIIIAEEQRRKAESERVARNLKIRTEKRNKEVAEIEQLMSQWLDEDGCPRFKSVNVGNMNTYLLKLYPRDSIIEAYKQFLDTEPFNALMRQIERDLERRGL